MDFYFLSLSRASGNLTNNVIKNMEKCGGKYYGNFHWEDGKCQSPQDLEYKLCITKILGGFSYQRSHMSPSVVLHRQNLVEKVAYFDFSPGLDGSGMVHLSFSPVSGYSTILNLSYLFQFSIQFISVLVF